MENKFIFLQRTRKLAGFTLIEVMVTVAIIAILAAIAMPAYTNYVTRGKIPDATSNLASKRVQMEQFFQDNHQYTCASGCTTPPACSSDNTSSKYFTFDCAGTHGGLTSTTYTIEAVGIGSMAGFIYTVDQDNNKITQAVPSSSWGTAPQSCWITKAGGVC